MTSGIGKESYAAASGRLASHVQRAEPTVAVAIGEEILAVARLLCDQPRLRRTLSDSGRTGDARVGLLRSLLEERVRGETFETIATVVGGRWANAGEFLDATERLGVEALLIAAERAGELAEVEDELFRFGQIVAGDSRLAGVLGDDDAGARRESLVGDLLADRCRPATLRLARLALTGLGGRGFAGSVTWLVEAAAKRRERTVAYVTTAVPLTAAEEQRMASLLTGLYGMALSLKAAIDPRVIGGVRVQVGSDVYDGTVQRLLANARHVMTR
ncbi:MAG: F0F1 ATP synthase subunit delta [Dactylosporangium sp.]|nr:F0F1 ATP synthase subunit delta [Dactylosporangium sp.]NNJ60811.1 F0F1 ATP synthase subunit delta [Dactylosporangium sp.]